MGSLYPSVMTALKEKALCSAGGTSSGVSRAAQGRNYRIQMFHELWRPPGQDQDTLDLMGKQSISFPATFILWGFFKSKQEACWKLWPECGPCTMTVHSPSGLATVEVVLGSLAQKTIFHLKKILLLLLIQPPPVIRR